MTTLKIQKENLLRGLSSVSKAVAQKGIVPILSNILLESEDGRLKLGATDLEISISCLVDVEEIEEFSTTVPARIFMELVSAIQEEELTFEYNPEKLVLKIATEKSNNNVRCLNSDDFPDMPVMPEETTMEMPSETFVEIVQRSVFSTATSDASQLMYKGVYFEAVDGELAVVSTDGFRFSLETMRVVSKDFKVIVPANYLNEFSKVANNKVEIAILENSIILRSGDVTAGILSISGKFPNIREKIKVFEPKDNWVKVSAKTSEMYKAVKHASIFCPEEKRTLTLDFKLITEIYAQADQIGDSLVSVAMECNGESIVHLNADFLMGVLSVAPENVKFYTSGENSPVVVKFDSEESYTHVMMPIKG